MHLQLEHSTRGANCVLSSLKKEIICAAGKAILLQTIAGVRAPLTDL